MKKKISFDFDDTLSTKEIQRIVKHLSDVYEVWVVTARDNDNPSVNDDLFKVTKALSVPTNKIVFMAGEPKHTFFKKNNGFILHVDDKKEERDGITKHTNVPTIHPNDLVEYFNEHPNT